MLSRSRGNDNDLWCGGDDNAIAVVAWSHDAEGYDAEVVVLRIMPREEEGSEGYMLSSVAAGEQLRQKSRV